MNKCKVKTCINDYRAQGLCSKHYQRHQAAIKKVAGIKAGKKCACGCNQFVPINAKFIAGHSSKIKLQLLTNKTIAVCKNPDCNNEFVVLHKKHSYCCEICKQSHYKSIGKTDEITRRFNKSAKGKARTKRYLQSEKGKIYNRNKTARYKERNPLKNLARIEAVKYLEEKSCSVEGCNQPGERHHEDYNRPLDVIYLCKKHHMDLHNNRLCLN